MPAESAVLYTRSSKDAHDISPAAQRAELKTFAKKKGYRIVGDYSDAAISANDNPPQLAAMLRELKDPARRWTVILAVDSSRLARDADLAGVINFQVRKAGCRVEFAKQPASGNVAMDTIFAAVSRAWDHYHSLISKEKGLQGMRVNVELGHRAGGRAPVGYKLQHVATGTMRGGFAVKKSHLVLDPQWAPRVKAYLQLRLRGALRNEAAKKSKLKKPLTTLISIERGALQYAGATVWNRHADPKATPGGDRFRPRSEWIVKRGTHPALISEAEAEALLAKSMPTGRRNKRGPSGNFLLTHLLYTPAGGAMTASGDGYYREGKGKRINAAKLEAAVLDHIGEEMALDEFVEGFVGELRRAAASLATDPADLRKELKNVERSIANLLKLAEQALGSPSLVARLADLESQRAEAEEALARAAESAERARALSSVTKEQARKLLAGGWVNRDGDATVEERRAALASFVERIVFDPEKGTGRVFYRWRGQEPGDFRLPTGVKLASPRGFEPRLSP